MEKKTKRSYCCVAGCFTGSRMDRKKRKLTGLKVPALFHPKTEKEAQLWNEIVRPSNRSLEIADCVCIKHFDPNNISMHTEVIMSDGTIKRFMKEKFRLKEGALPSKELFPEEPEKFATAEGLVVSASPDFSRFSANEMIAAESLVALPTSADFSSSFNENEMLAAEGLVMLPSVDHLAEPESNIVSDFEELKSKFSFVPAPSAWWGITSHPDFIICAEWSKIGCLKRKIIVNREMTIKAYLENYEIETETNKVSQVEDISKAMEEICEYRLCPGVGDNATCFVKINQKSKAGYCQDCRVQRARTRKYNWDKQHRRNKPKSKISSAVKVYKKRTSLLKDKVTALRKKIKLLSTKCASTNKRALDESIQNLPPKQQESIKACLLAAQLKTPQGARYSLSWIYECILLRIKSKRLYQHLRENKILTLPSMSTIRRYLKSVKGMYGFQTEIFDCMREKCKGMHPSDRRGALLLDEMKVSPTLTFDSSRMTFEGFVNLGSNISGDNESQKGDAVLVLMFQPFKGKWVQAVACFLSKGATTGNKLHQLILEAVFLLEQSGLFVDAVVCDGATWNRNMWKKFGVEVHIPSCEHPVLPSRRLWFISDFPHLIKCIRNFFTDKRQVQVHKSSFH